MNEPRVVTSADAFRRAGTTAADGSRIPVEVRVTVADPFLAYRRARDGPGGVFLETTGGQSGWGYFGCEQVNRLAVAPEAVRREPDDEGSPSLAALEGLLAGETLARGDCDVPFPCGAIGWLSYDIARELEALDSPESAVDDRGLPRLEVAVYDRLAAWEVPDSSAEKVTLRITACPRIERTDDPERLRAAYERARARALELAERALEGDPAVGEPPVSAPEATFESACGREAFADRVRRVKEYIREGDTFQANVSQRLEAPAAVHPVEAYDALRRVNPAPYSGLCEFRSADLVSASPELLLEYEEQHSSGRSSGQRPRERDGDFVRTEPIAGTRPRGRSPEEDDALESDLLGDEKERAEHAMLVDLERNDLGKVCAYGSVDVAEYRRVDRYSEVMHLVSNVTGTLRAGASLSDAIAATFPGGTITGAPKPRTMEIIDELESTRRGPYTGSMGVFGFDGRATLNIVIRTLVRHGGAYHLRVGAGIVHDSDPAREYEETLDKARALITAIDTALGERAGMALEADGRSDPTDAGTEGGS